MPEIEPGRPASVTAADRPDDTQAVETSPERDKPRREPRLSRYYRDLLSFPRDALSAYRREGLIGPWMELRHRTVDRVYQSWYHLLVEGSLEPEIPPIAAPAGIDIHPLADDAWPRVLDMADSRGRQKLQAMKDCGQICLLAWRGDRVVGHIWIAPPGTADSLFPGVQLPDEGVFFHLLYVTRPERRQGIGSSMHRAAGHHAKALGYRFIWAATEMANRSANKSLTRTKETGAAVTRVGTVRLSLLLGRPSMQLTLDPEYRGPLTQCFP